MKKQRNRYMNIYKIVNRKLSEEEKYSKKKT